MPPGTKAGRRRWIRSAVLGCAIGAVVAAGLLAIPRATEAATCDYWIGGTGNFSTASNWSTGAVPNTAADACITQTTSSTPPAAADTYTVLVDTNQAVGTLMLGGANGTQTLQVAGNNSQFLINTIGTINTKGVLLVGDGNVANGYSWLAAGSNSSLLTNNGTIRTVQGGGGSRLIRGNLTNGAAGTVDIAAVDTRQDSANTVTNNGSFTVEVGATFAMSGNGGIFANLGGSVTNLGSFSQNGGTFTERGGSETGNPVLLQSGGLDDDLSAGAAKFTISNPGAPPYPLTGTGTLPGIAAGQVLTIAGNNSFVDLGTSLTNAGTLVFGDAGTGYSVLRAGNASASLTNTGRVNTVQGGGGNRYFRTNVTNAADGIVDIGGPTLLDVNTLTFANNGTLTIEPGSTFYLSAGATLTQGAGGTFQTTIDANAAKFGHLDGGTDAVNVGGTLKVITVGHPLVGSTWPIIANASRAGTFASTDFGGFNYQVMYPATGVTLVAQANCDTWVGGIDNNFGTAGNWSFGASPTSADDACITATTTTIPKATADTYTVALNGGPSVHSLTLGGPNGTQTVVMPASGAQLSLGAASTINANGVLTLGDAGTGDSILCCAGVTLTNNGQFNTVGALGNRYLRVSIANSGGGKVDIAAKSTLQDGSTTTTNSGVVTIEASGGLGVIGPGSFINSAGSVTNNGAFSMNGNATFTQRGGTESGTPVYLNNGSTLDDDLGAGTAGFFFASGGETLTGTGASPGVAAGQTVTIAAGTGTTTTLGVNLTNAGTIVMGDAGSGDSTVCCATNTLTNTGHLNTIQGGGGTRYLRVNLTNNSSGTIDVAAAKTFQSGASTATTTTNNGAMTIEASGGFGVFGPGSFINSGGSVTNNGAFSMNGNATFTQRGGTESGTPVYLNNGSTLDDDLAAGAAGFIFSSGGETLTGTGASPGVAAGQMVTIAAGTGTQISLAVNITNAGTIVMGDSAAGLTALNGPGSLTNAGHLNTIQGGGGTRYLRANITNTAAGMIDVAATSTFQDGSTTTTNNGTVTIEAGGGLGLMNGTFLNAGGGVTNNGAFSVNTGATFMQRAGTESGTPVYILSSSTLDDDVNAGAAGFILSCPSCVVHLTGTGSTPGVAIGQVLTIPADGTEVDLGANLTNAGTIVLGDAGTALSILCGPGFTLTNTGQLNTVKGGAVASNVNRYLRVNISNAAGGSIDIAFTTFSDGVLCAGAAGPAPTTITNSGTVTFESGGLWLLSGGFTQTAGGTFVTTIDVSNPSSNNRLSGGPINLDGKLKVTTIGTPATNSRWFIMHGAIGAGRFASFNRGGVGYQIDYSSTDVMLVVRPIRPYHPLPPARILDTRPGSQVGPFSTPLGAQETRDVQITGQGGVPAGASAVVINATVTDTSGASFLTVFPTGVARPVASNLNWTAGKTAPNLVQVALSAEGKVSIYNQVGTTDVVFDVAGYIDAPTVTAQPDGLFHPVVPDRVLDTRNGNGAPQAQVGPRQTITVQIAGRAGSGVPATGVSAVVLNVTATNPSAQSYLTVWPSGVPQPVASNVNFLAGQSVPNRVIVKLGSSGSVSFYNAVGSVDVIADVGGWFTDATPDGIGSTFTGLTPARILDTRPQSQVGPFSTPFGPNETRTVLVAGQGLVPGMNATPQPAGVVLNVTVTNPTAASYLTVWPDDAATRPNASDLNNVAGQTVPNLVVVRLGADGSISLYNAAGSSDVIIDVVGYYN